MTIPRLYVPMLQPEDVVRHLGDQEKHWKAGRSAHALTNLWFRANAIPQSVQSMLAGHPIFHSAVLIDAFLERQVDLGTVGRHSQTDLLAVVGLGDRIAIIAVEGKAGEPFGNEYVHQWLDGSKSKAARLDALCATLGISIDAAKPLRYQLLHRAASAIYEARRYRSKLAIMLIQSFTHDEASFIDFSAFVQRIGIKREARRNILLGPIEYKELSFYVGWLDDRAPDVGSGSSYLDDLRNYADKLSQWCNRVRTWCDERSLILKK